MIEKNNLRELNGSLGSIYPYRNLNLGMESDLLLSDLVSKMIRNKEELKLDLRSVAVKAISPFLFGQRTMLNEVSRLPWYFDSTDSSLALHELPPHGLAQPLESEFVKQLKQALVAESKVFIGNARTVGILLSGGMDSRIVAGIVRSIQLQADFDFEVVALTWGNDGCRDVEYAKRIASLYDWNIKHFPLTESDLRRNIVLAGELGAEVSPLHYHAMEKISLLSGIDVILAGSYGDSVGRAEFSGRHLTQLKSVESDVADKFRVLKPEWREAAMQTVQEDILTSRSGFEAASALRQNEIDQQAHYMRRMLQSCMQLISSRIPLYQAFTSPGVFGLMWSLNPADRTDKWYKFLLNELPGELHAIPWARTGKRYLESDDKADNLNPKYHRYGPWLRNELREEVLDRIHSTSIQNLGIFNQNSLRKLENIWIKSTTETSNSLDELMSWLASLNVFLDTYKPTIGIKKENKRCMIEKYDSYIGSAYAYTYVTARNRLRK